MLDEAVVCVDCGCSLKSTNESDVNNEPLSGGVQALSFCFPYVGGILWLVHKNSAPQKSKDACHMALWGVGVSILLNVIAGAVGGY